VLAKNMRLRSARSIAGTFPANTNNTNRLGSSTSTQHGSLLAYLRIRCRPRWVSPPNAADRRYHVRQTRSTAMPINTPVTDAMSSPVVVVGPRWSVSEVMSLARERGVHHFPIVDAGTLVGLVCTCDLEQAMPSVQVGDLRRRSVVTLPLSSTTLDAARALTENKVGSVVVTGPDGIAGLVTRENLTALNATLAALLEDERCTACGDPKHLRPTADGRYLCAECIERASMDDWYDLGTAD
jgi:CBS domain-containing protein